MICQSGHEGYITKKGSQMKNRAGRRSQTPTVTPGRSMTFYGGGLCSSEVSMAVDANHHLTLEVYYSLRISNSSANDKKLIMIMKAD